MLSSSFNIMEEGMEVSQYMKFRNTLTPASGFQSAQYRMIEFCSTELINLIDYRFRSTIDRDTPYEHAFEHLYWQAAGKNHATGEKTTLMKLFEERYKEEFLRKMKKYNTINLWTKYKNLPEADRQNIELINAISAVYTSQKNILDESDVYINSMTNKIGDKDFSNQAYLILLRNYSYDLEGSGKSLKIQIEKLIELLNDSKS